MKTTLKTVFAVLLVVFATAGLSATGTASYQWGLSTDISVPGDFDGDGLNDLAVFRPSTGKWYIVYSSHGLVGANTYYTIHRFGLSGDVPHAKDHDADGIDDLIVYRPSNGTWYVAFSAETSWDTQYNTVTSSSGGAATNGSAVSILD